MTGKPRGKPKSFFFLGWGRKNGHTQKGCQTTPEFLVSKTPKRTLREKSSVAQMFKASKVEQLAHFDLVIPSIHSTDSWLIYGNLGFGSPKWRNGSPFGFPSKPGVVQTPNKANVAERFSPWLSHPVASHCTFTWVHLACVEKTKCNSSKGHIQQQSPTSPPQKMPGRAVRFHSNDTRKGNNPSSGSQPYPHPL